MTGRATRYVTSILMTVTLTACHHHHSTNAPPSPTSYTLGGSISGLTASGLVLANGSMSVAPAANATSFTFAAQLVSGNSYQVTVTTQPAGQTCTVSNASGTIAAANVTNVQVTCTTNTYSVGGSISGLTSSGLVLANSADTFAAAAGATSFTMPTALPSGTAYSVTVSTQPSGESCTVSNGSGTIASANITNIDITCAPTPPPPPPPTTLSWVWRSGASTVNASGVYGTQGVAATSNVPGARGGKRPVSWTDHGGNLWLFGGFGRDSAGAIGLLNDLWRYNPASGQWTWMSGSNTGGASGVYGTQGMAAAGNTPGARDSAVSWSDGAGNLWLFGGDGRGATGPGGRLNDLWKYNTSSGQWTWVSGSTGNGTPGVYGVEGTAAASNAPGARRLATSWTDSAGNLWLFGGYGVDSTGANSDLNDLWQYSPTTGQWTWMSGSNMSGVAGVYGTQGTAAASNMPGARDSALSWVDSADHLWLFGGAGFDSNVAFNNLNDLWEFGNHGR